MAYVPLTFGRHGIQALTVGGVRYSLVLDKQDSDGITLWWIWLVTGDPYANPPSIVVGSEFYANNTSYKQSTMTPQQEADRVIALFNTEARQKLGGTTGGGDLPTTWTDQLDAILRRIQMYVDTDGKTLQIKIV